MTLCADMLPDPGWKRRGRVERDGQALSVTRAKVLHASASVRNCLLWAIVLSSFHLWDVLPQVWLLTPQGFASPLTTALFWFTIVINHLDRQRAVDLEGLLKADPAYKRDLYEIIAIPLLCFSAVSTWLLVIGLASLLKNTAPDALPLLKSVWSLMAHIPWMALTALLMALGGWLRRSEALASVLATNADSALPVA